MPDVFSCPSSSAVKHKAQQMHGGSRRVRSHAVYLHVLLDILLNVTVVPLCHSIFVTRSDELAFTETLFERRHNHNWREPSRSAYKCGRYV